MDMDELFSQVDEKRKVSMKILLHSLIFTRLFADFPYYYSCCWRSEVYRTQVLFVLADTLAHGAHTDCTPSLYGCWHGNKRLRKPELWPLYVHLWRLIWQDLKETICRWLLKNVMGLRGNHTCFLAEPSLSPAATGFPGNHQHVMACE